MKQLIALLAFLISAVSLYAYNDGSSPITVSMEKDEIDDPIYNNPTRNRMPSKQIVCTINIDGLYSASFDVEEVTLFEINGSEGNHLQSFIDEAEFISYLFSLSGEYEIRLHFDEFILKGYICL